MLHLTEEDVRAISGNNTVYRHGAIVLADSEEIARWCDAVKLTTWWDDLRLSRTLLRIRSYLHFDLERPQGSYPLMAPKRRVEPPEVLGGLPRSRFDELRAGLLDELLQFEKEPGHPSSLGAPASLVLFRDERDALLFKLRFS